jgi:hypothetical protein
VGRFVGGRHEVDCVRGGGDEEEFEDGVVRGGEEGPEEVCGALILTFWIPRWGIWKRRYEGGEGREGIPVYRVIYTMRYRACDLNDIPAQLYFHQQIFSIFLARRASGPSLNSTIGKGTHTFVCVIL